MLGIASIIILRGVLIAAVHVEPGTTLAVGPGVVIDPDTGAVTTVDVDTARTFLAHGIADEADPDAVPDTVDDDLHLMSIAQLRAVAAVEDVDLGTTLRKAEILEVIREVRAGRAA